MSIKDQESSIDLPAWRADSNALCCAMCTGSICFLTTKHYHTSVLGGALETGTTLFLDENMKLMVFY